MSTDRGRIITPSESGSLRVRVAKSCPWNACLFCGMYKGKPYEEIPFSEISESIESRQDGHSGAPYKKAFLQDANALALPTKDLIQIVRKIHEVHPHVERIASYARNDSLSKKSLQELAELRESGLTAVYLGLESGYDPLLAYMKKGTTARELIATGLKVKASGLELSDFVMPGLGGNLMLEGKETWRMHATETARVVNEINPDYIRLRTLFIYPRTPLWDKAQAGEYQRLSDPEIVREQRVFLEMLDVTSQVQSNYLSNILLELKGKLPEDKDMMLGLIDQYLGLSSFEQHAFRIGMLFGRTHSLQEFEKKGAASVVNEAIERFFIRFGSRYV